MEVWKSVLVFLLLSVFYAYVHGSPLIASAPQSIDIQGNDFFLVDVYNPSNATQPLTVAFYSPVTGSITHPSVIAPQSHTTIKVALKDASYTTATQITGKLSVSVGPSNDSREITLNYKPTVSMSSQISKQVSGMFGAFFSMGSLVPEVGSFSLVEWALFWVMIIVAAILLVAFIARISRRA